MSGEADAARPRLDILLVELHLFDSRAKAQAAIEAGGVRVDGRTVRRASARVAREEKIEAEAAHPWVSRAALKLDHALSTWPIRVDGRVVLDVGASTGGFTQVCLARGAARVYAVDVGRGQIEPRLAADPRVVSLEGTDARRLEPQSLDQAPELVVCDASFIGLAKVLPAALALAPDGADLVALIKPQFEVGPGHVGKGGVVKDASARDMAIRDVVAFLERSGWTVRGLAESPITGGDGNREHLCWAVKGLKAPATEPTTPGG